MIIMVIEFRRRTVRTVHAWYGCQGRKESRAQASCYGVGSFQGRLLGQVVDEGNPTVKDICRWTHFLSIFENWDTRSMTSSKHCMLKLSQNKDVKIDNINLLFLLLIKVLLVFSTTSAPIVKASSLVKNSILSYDGTRPLTCHPCCEHLAKIFAEDFLAFCIPS